MSNLGLFVVGVLITVPSAAVVIALVFAAGIDDRAEKRLVAQHEPAPMPSVRAI